MADFVLVSRKALAGDPVSLSIFKWHVLYGAAWPLCAARLSITRGEFFHHLYRMQQTLGRVYRELAPYALFPLDEYFGSQPGKLPTLPSEQEELALAQEPEPLPDFRKRRGCRYPLQAKAAG